MGTLVFALFLHSQLVQLVILYIIAPTPSLLTRSRSFTPLHSSNSRYFSHKIPFAKMYKFLILAASAAFASAYTTPTTQCTDGCNPIAKPGLNEVVPAGTEYTITWQPTTAGTVSIVLLKGPSENILPLYAVAEKIANTGTYSWTPAADLEPTGNSGYSGVGSASGSASPSASASATAASNGTISSSAAPTVSHPIGFSNSTASFSSIVAVETDSTTTLSTASRPAGVSATSSEPAQSTNGAAALGAMSIGGVFAVVMAAFAAL